MNQAAACPKGTGCSQSFSYEQASLDDTRIRRRSITQTLNLWYERSRQRRQLLAIADDPDIMRDLGLSNYDLRREGKKPFWRK